MKVKENEYYICDICNKRIELAPPPYVGWRGCKIGFKKTTGLCNFNSWHEYDICHSCFDRMVEFCKEGGAE